jgi:aspartate-semialdehyde dehydrogenase
MIQRKAEGTEEMRTYTVAILGATGLVGGKLIALLEERNFPVQRLLPLASRRTAGETILFKGQPITVLEATPEIFQGVDIVLASAGGNISEVLVPEAVKRGAVVIDNTSQFRLVEGVPLVVAGVNDSDLQNHRGIIANPNCSTMQLMPILKALDALAGIERVIVSTYQSASGAGKEAIDELCASAGELVATQFKAIPQSKNFSRPLAFNVIPQIDVFMEDGYTKEEFKVYAESRKILHRPDLKISCTAVRVPVLVGHSEAVNIDFKRPVSPEEVAACLGNLPDVIVANSPADFHTPQETAETDPVYVSRIRQDSSNPECGIALWIVADNLRIGAALNAVRLAEVLHQQNLVSVPQHV